MTGILNILAGSISSAIKDGYFNLVSLLLPGNGTNGAQNNTFLDSSTNNFTITRNGNTTQGTFSPFSQTGWGNYFNGTNASLTYPNNTAFAFGTGAFTIEFWINGPSNDNTFILGGRSAIGTMHITTGGTSTGTTVSCLRYVGSSTITTSSTLITNNSWNHCAIVRDGSNNITLYVNGVSAGTGTDTTNYTTTSGTWYIGQNDSGSANYLQGYISNLRILKGTALYTGSFTPPTAPLTAITNTSLLTCQSNRFIDNSANAFAITVNGTPSVQAFSPFAPTAAYSAATNGGSGYFDGSGDYLTLADSTAWDLTGDYTLEMWLYPLATTGGIFGIGDYRATFNGMDFYFNANKIELYVNGAAVLTGATTIVRNQWYHLALVRSGSSTNNTKLYINGVQDAQGTNNTSFTGVAGNGASIGNDYGGSYGAASVNGYISGLRLLKGTAQYTSAFTPPTSPPTAITNTVLLTNFTNAGITDATAKNDLETVGNAQISTTQSKFGGSSMYFDGTGDYLYANSSASNAAFGTGDFTVEFWLYTAAGSTTYNLLDWRPTTTHGAYLTVYLDVGVPKVVVNSTTIITGGSAISATTWTHVAVCRSGTSTKMFINGTQSGSTATDSTNYLGLANRPAIGGGGYDTGSILNGYIDDLRITKGYARYTANFSVPTAAFPLS
jgi:hypothetical protein